ncbi:hypothetical protein N0V82_009894 [Gnomoniopsis sp. IMI 355080]|nr:hypothetical protein N0V82_009894 [Gnomoniopsis sp. IMI 355080]
MAIDSVPVWMQNFEAQIINDFIERLCIFLHPHKFDMMMQNTFDWQEERERENMAHWREAHGLPNWPSARRNLATTPPMPLPFIDHQHHLSSLDTNLATSFGVEGQSIQHGPPGWTSGSSSSSPFRQVSMHHGAMEETVSPRELLSHDSHAAAMLHAAPYTEDLGMFTFSDSDSALHSLPQPAMPSNDMNANKNNRRKTGQRSGTSTRFSQNPAYQHGRRPLPAGPGQSVSRGQSEESGTYGLSSGNDFGQQSYSTQNQQQQSTQEPILRSNGPESATGYKALRPSRRQPTSQLQTHAFGGPLHTAPTTITTSTTTTTTSPMSTFPPGQDMPGFVPIGRVGVASAAQGNHWPIDRKLMEQLVGAERGGHGEHRPKTRLAYREIQAKYSRWPVKESTLRGIMRKISLPKEHRERKPTWDAEHIKSLRRHVPIYTNKKGKVAWAKVVEAIKHDTGRPFGASTTAKKWKEINSKVKTKRRGAAADQQSQSGGEEGDIEENGSSSSFFEIGDVSEEDLPSHKFSFQVEGDDDDNLGGVGRFAPVNAPGFGLQGPRMWHD